jgi:hypothetical protein
MLTAWPRCMDGMDQVDVLPVCLERRPGPQLSATPLGLVGLSFGGLVAGPVCTGRAAGE